MNNKIKSVYRFLSPKYQNLFLDYKVDFKPRYGHGKSPHTSCFPSLIQDATVTRRCWRRLWGTKHQYGKSETQKKRPIRRNLHGTMVFCLGLTSSAFIPCLPSTSRQDRFYSEQYGLAMYLLANPRKFEPLLPNYFISQDKELSQYIEPIWNHPRLKGVERHGGSFWLRIVE